MTTASADDAVGSEVARYLAALPRGLDSYPECQTKFSSARHALLRRPFVPEAGRFPPAVEKLMVDPPPAGTWVPSVHFHCVMTAIRESLFPGPGGEAPYFQFMRETNRDMYHRPMYRILFFLTSPKRLLVGLERRWEQFNRGTTLSLVENGERIITVALAHPPHLFAHDHDRGWSGAIHVAIECAGGREPVVSPQRVSPTKLVLRIAWH